MVVASKGRNPMGAGAVREGDGSDRIANALSRAHIASGPGRRSGTGARHSRWRLHTFRGSPGRRIAAGGGGRGPPRLSTLVLFMSAACPSAAPVGCAVGNSLLGAEHGSST